MFGLLLRHSSWPLAIVLSADRVPVKSTRSYGAVALVGCPDLWIDWLGCAFRCSPFPTSVAGSCPRVFGLASYAGSGGRWLSLRAIRAQAVLAILFVSATAAIFTGHRSMSLVSQGWRV